MQGRPTQNQPQSPQSYQQAAAAAATAPAPSSGLSNMFGRTGPAPAPAPPGLPSSISAAQQNGFLSAVVAADQGAAIGMSPIGLPIPADLPLPPGVSPSINSKLPGSAEQANGQNGNKPKPFSYASAVATAAAAAANAATGSSSSQGGSTAPSSSSPTTSKLVSPTVNATGLPAIARSPTTAMTSATATYASKAVNPASPSFAPRVPINATQAQAAAQAQATNRLSSSVPSTFSMDKLDRHLPHLAQQQQQSSLQPTSPYHRQPHHPSPLAPPPLQHSLSHSNTIPTRASFVPGPGAASGPLSPAALSHHAHSIPHHPRASGSSGNIFGTSPFGANAAIFLSSSHEEEPGSYMSRADRAPGARRHMSPARTGFEPSSASARGSLDSRSFTRNKHGSSALADDFEDGTEDDKVLEEELVPSSLKHLLTPDEKARRQSRSGAVTKSGFFNPFDDDNDNDNDEDEFDRHLEAELRQRYSQSVPAAVSGYFNKAPGSPPVFTGNAGYLSSLGRPPLPSPGNSDAYGSGAIGQTNQKNNTLPKHLLTGGAGGAQHTHKIERGFMTSDNGTGSNSGGNDRPQNGPGYLATLGTSLPQGMAVGLSRLHMIPAGSEHTGYTPPASFVQSPPGSSGQFAGDTGHYQTVSSGPNNNNNHNSGTAGGTTSNSLLVPNSNSRGSGGPAAMGTSYGIKLPSLLGQQHPGIGSRKSSGNYYEANQVHVGSPLARHEIHSHIGSSSGSLHANVNNAPSHDATQGQAVPDEDDLVFDMDV